MKVFDLTCIDGHRFEGWFASAEQFAAQCEASDVRCPLCDSSDVQRAPSAPRLNLGGEQPSDIRVPAKASPTAERAAVASVLERLRRMVAETENVGPRFAEEARRIHYAEAEARPIRGTATDRERRELSDEGIETVTIALPPAVTETLQ
jgi:hypothetical protein